MLGESALHAHGAKLFWCASTGAVHELDSPVQLVSIRHYNTAISLFQRYFDMSFPSMTGFGAASVDCRVGKINLEIKSVNSRFFEFSPRLPDEFRWMEQSLREQLQRAVSRGKIELRLGLSRTESSLAQSRVSESGLASALRLAHEIRRDHPEITPFSVTDLIQLPGVLEEAQMSQEEWSAVLQSALEIATRQFLESRLSEGRRLAKTIEDRLAQIESLAQQAGQLIPEAIKAQQTKLGDKLREALAGSITETLTAEQAASLDDRVRQEAAAFGLRIDIAEEIDRLGSHVRAMRQALAKPTTSGVGKRIDFLSQELNREANTLGSKAASAELSAISIELKLLIEQIREQAQNLE